MLCPHCSVHIHPQFEPTPIKRYYDDEACVDKIWYTHYTRCPNCFGEIIELRRSNIEPPQKLHLEETIIAYPKVSSRKPLPIEMPKDLKEDYREACLVLADSPKASAALSRRCLQHLLRDYAKVKPSDLSKEIDEIHASGKLPSDLAEAIDAIRNIGNFAAHPMKSTHTGEIIPVEVGEADWILDVLEDLLDFYFVRPESLKKKKEELNKKLKSAGKPEMK